MFHSILPTWELLSKLELIPSSPATVLSTEFMSYFTSLVVISTVFTASSAGVDFILRNYLLCFAIRSHPSFVKVWSWVCSNSVMASGSTSSSLAMSTTSAVNSSTEVLNPSKSSMRVGIGFFQTPIGILTSSHESLLVQTVKNPPAMQETWVWSLCLEAPLEEEMAIRSSSLAWEIPWREESGGLQPIGSQRVRHNWMTPTHTWITNVLYGI